MLVFLSFTLVVAFAQGASIERIINGQDATMEDHPHQIALKRFSTNINDWYHTCGGSIVGDIWIVTAAHCVDGAAASSLRVDLNDGRQNDPGNVGYAVSQVIMHPTYNQGSGAYPNDIAVLRLSSAIDFSSGHKAIALANTGESFDGATCEVSGWGHTVTGTQPGKQIPNQLQETDGVILTDSQCNAVWGRNYASAAHICIDNPSTGTCQGDSGGPMVCMRGTTPVLAGATSWGVSGCATNYPSVYARVSTYRAWIDGILSA